MTQLQTIRECRRCIMTSAADPDLEVDAEGICHHCRRYDVLLPIRVMRGAEGKAALDKIVDTLKERGKGREYDCLIGVSGGVDSTYVAYLTKQLGLRPLAVHLDNGWNSELAVKNIQRTMEKLGIDLHTEVLDWDEFRDLQISFLKASTPDLDIPSDHAITATMWLQARKHGIKHIISGMNFVTESTHVKSWSYGHWDWPYISGLHKRFGKIPLRTYPHYTTADMIILNAIYGLRSISILNYIDFNKRDAMDTLVNEFAWKYYGGKHYESIYTRFIQGYVLPVKFGVDKRYGHLSDLIRSGQMTRDEALAEIAEPPYPSDLFAKDYAFVLKKFGMSDEQFQAIMHEPVKSFRNYRNTEWVGQALRNSITFARRIGVYPR